MTSDNDTTAAPFVPQDFDVPTALNTPHFRLEPLGPEHNARDLAAWTGSIAHIRSSPGWETQTWPPLDGMSAEQNLGDLQEHADDFAQRKGFTYSVIEDPDEVIGCVYIYPSRDPAHHTAVRSWVRADRAELDAPLRTAVSAWLSDWPLGSVNYAPARPSA
ncbi:GNAT family N-acetyltransferase [Streptomyces sp. NBC_00239]|uniref:GNAT family N-acetyltransferase n=1 Tax=Streptomyces sp. NBC_00239 TaxID=2903640 RepID=UPI002E2BAC1E|nr:N-acetyltransferase [Streptomyces sp. NBC_00239]